MSLQSRLALWGLNGNGNGHHFADHDVLTEQWRKGNPKPLEENLTLILESIHGILNRVAPYFLEARNHITETMLPVATNLRIIRTPWATYSIACVNIVVHLLATWNTNFIISERVAGTFGFVPASIPNLNLPAVPTIVTSMFLHGDPLHLIGNMVFLLVFGRKVETQLERTNFIAFYFATGITAAMAHPLMEPRLLGTAYRRQRGDQWCLGSVPYL